jgi:amidase
MTHIRKTMLETIWAIQDGTAGPDSAISASVARVKAIEPWLHAFCYLPATHTTNMHGPLRGIPVGVKDIIATADMPTTNGSPIYADETPASDAWIVQRTRELGGTIFGKTVTTEFAWRYPGPTVNPWNPQHTPGGSSSGSAAAVAAGLVLLAFGTQTMGSIIRPAAYNGVVGYKPSFDSIARVGVHPLAGSLDHVGFFTNTVADAAAAFAMFIDAKPEVTISPGAWGSYLSPLNSSPKFAVIRTGIWDRADAEQKNNFEAQLAAFVAAGAQVMEFDLPEASELIIESAELILEYEAARIYQPLVSRYPHKTSDRLKQLVADGMSVSEDRYRAALALQSRLRGSLAAWIAPCDAILTVPATGPAPHGLTETGDAKFCAPWTLMGAPAVSIPAGWSAQGLPIGLQIVGLFGEDKALLQVAAWAETVVNFPTKTVAAA